MEALSLYLPAWPSDRVRRRWLREGRRREGQLRESRFHESRLGESPALAADTPILLTRVDHERTVVASCCPVAIAGGVRAGMPRPVARALLNKPAHVEELSEAEDRRDLERLARWAYRFAPIVAVDGDDGLLLDLRGCGRLYGHPSRLALRLMERLGRAGIYARIGAAPTFGAAWALARYGEKAVTIVDRAGLAGALANLPIEGLRLDEEHAEALGALGVRTIGELRAIPRAALASRYGGGHGVLLRLDQAFGQGGALEIVTPIQPRQAIRAERMFDGPTHHLESIMVATRMLVEELASMLIRAHRGTLSLLVELVRSDLQPLHIPVRTSRPCADARHLWKILTPRLEKAHLGFGVEGVRLTVLRSRRLRDEQGVCWEGEGKARENTESLSRLIDTLHARLAPGQVLRPVAAQSHVPERAFAFAPALESGKPAAIAVPELPIDRPTVVLDAPVPVDVSLLIPDGPLVHMRLDGETRRVLSCHGPERIGGEWWRGGRGDKHERDYFKVNTDDGRWLWVYREMRERNEHQSRWFLHGEWA